MNFNLFRKEIKSGNASVKELVNEFFLKIDSLNPKINSYTCITKQIANSQSEKIDEFKVEKEASSTHIISKTIPSVKHSFSSLHTRSYAL